jgi:hypothetical protein
LTLVTHHAINFEKVKLSNRIRTLVVKVGNEFRPASVEDIESIRLLFEQAILDNSLTIITHHAISFEYIDRKCLNRTKISSSPNIQNTFQTINNTIVGEENSSRMYVIVNK